MSIRKAVIILVVLISVELFPQGEAAIPFLLLPTSPTLNGAGATGTATLIDDPYKVYFNPAHLGYSSRTSGIAIGFYPGKINWLSRFVNGMTVNSYVFNQGLNLEKILPGIPLSIGFAYSKSEFVYGEAFGNDTEDYYSSYSLGIGYHSLINLSFGFTVKDITSFLGGNQFQFTPRVNTTAVDYGVLLNLPVNNLLEKPIGFKFTNNSSIQADVNYTIGYTIQNIGDEIYYVDPDQSDPIGRTARLAHNIDLGILLKTGKDDLNLVNLSYSIDAEDILIKRNYDTTTFVSNIEYEGMFGTIKPFKNLFLGEGDADIVLHKGLIVEFFESVYFSWGGLNGRGFTNRETSGFGLRTKGFLKLLNISLQSEVLKYISDHFDIRYTTSTYFEGSEFESEFKGVTISVGGF
ncbi:MAG: hypothetical protein R6W90_03880 [Ignavibacteriaceae bacterium]